MSDPQVPHISTSKHVFRCLKSTHEYILLFIEGDDQIEMILIGALTKWRGKNITFDYCSSI